VWTIYLLAWTAALLTPYPVAVARSVSPPELRLLAAKSLHVAAYALLAVLSGWLRPPGRSRWLLLALLCAHAAATEFGQRFVATRSASWRDVGLNHLGLLLGLALSWRWWRAPARPAPRAEAGEVFP
jgi:VanZ family protein